MNLSRRELMIGAGAAAAMAAVPAIGVAAAKRELPALLPLDGRWLATADYPELFAALGYTYGGAGGKNFRLPNMVDSFGEVAQKNAVIDGEPVVVVSEMIVAKPIDLQPGKTLQKLPVGMIVTVSA